MESYGGDIEHNNLSHDIYYGPPEYFALQALVDTLFEKSDKEVFEILNKQTEKEEGGTS